MARRPCPTGGKDLPDGGFCEACGVYNHVEAARSRRPAAFRALRRPGPSGTFALGVKALVAGAAALLLVNSMFRRAKGSEDRTPSVHRVQAYPNFDPTRARDPVRSSSLRMQAEAMRRREAAQRSAPEASKADDKEERRRKRRLARSGLGL